jgi:phosphoglycolate phosphatase
MVDHLFPGTFEFVFGHREGYAIKPDPQTALEIIAASGEPKDRVAMVGDTPIDVHMARGAGIYVVAVPWGYRPVEELVVAQPDDIAVNCTALQKILLKYLTR